MIKKTFVLLRVQLLGFFGLNKLRHGGSGKQRRNAVLMGVLMVFVIVLLAAYCGGAAYALAVIGAGEAIAPVFLALCGAITVVFTFTKSQGVLFGFKDYDTVMSLPVTSGAVIASRLLAVYIGNLLFSALALLPALGVYGSMVSLPFSFWLFALLGLLFAPMLPMIVAMILGALIAGVASRFKRSNAISIVLSVVFTVGILAGSMSVQNIDFGGVQLEQFGGQLVEALGRFYPPARFYGAAANNGDVVSFLLFVAISAVPAALFVFLLGRVYTKINSALIARHARSNFKLGAQQAGSPRRALLKKELKRLFSSTLYLLNTGIGGLLLLVAGVALLFVDFSSFEATLELPAGSLRQYGALAPIFASFFTIMGSVTSVSMNMEGKSLWLLCSLPVEPKTVYEAKIGANLVLMLAMVVPGGALLAVGLAQNALQAALMVLVPSAYVVFMAVVGMRMNLRYPRYDWTTEQQAVKQSASLMMTMLVGFAAIVPLMVGGFMLSQYAVWLELAAVVILLGLSWLIYNRLKKIKLYV